MQSLYDIGSSLCNNRQDQKGHSYFQDDYLNKFDSNPGLHENALVYVPEEPKVTSVEVTPATATVVAGSSLALTTVVTVSGFAPQTVTYESNNSGVTITEGGVVQVASDATGTATITITSTYDTTKKDTVSITIS